MGVETMNHQMQMQMQMQMQIHGARPPFTPSQWQELEHQALIFKYMVAGIPVPPDLLVPIRKSLEAISAGLFHPHHHPPDMPWSSTFQLGYGKNCDPEPGRCRRTDGKKWRCSKDAFPDSKYCERHMHRGRNRSRKPVETPHASSHSSSLTLSTTARPTNNNNSSSSITSNNSHTFSSPSPYSSSSRLSGGGIVVQPNNANVNHFNLDSPSFARDYRYMKGDMDEHIFFSSEVSGTASRALGIESQPLLSSTSSMDVGWRSNPAPKVNALFNTFPKQQQQHSFLNSSFEGTVKMEAQDHDEDNNTQEQDHEHEQPLRHFFDDWPATRSRDSSSGLSWCDLEERCNTSSAHNGNHRASATSSSTTQLSISIPINSSDFSASKSK